MRNLTLWSVQCALLVAVATLFPALARLTPPRARLLYWQIVLLACLILPLLHPWETSVVIVNVTHAPSALYEIPIQPASPIVPSLAEIAIWTIAAGVAGRMIWFGLGFLRLRRYRRNARPLIPPSSWGVEAELLVSNEIQSPVTFGWRNPVVLLPGNFDELNASARDAVLCHEILHVRRRDWLFTISEEFLRALLWFHPAIWWVLGEIQLAREQVVDGGAIEMLQTKDEYVDALLSLAGASAGVDAAPAFLRKRHLKKRVLLILKEGRMSKKRTVSMMMAGVGVLCAAAWMITGAIPLRGAPQAVADAPGVAVEMNGTQLLHRSSIPYPPAALAKGVEGNVTALLRTDGDGNVIDASISSGPDELRKSVLQSVLGWHLGKAAAGTTRQITVGFALPKEWKPAANGTAPVPAAADTRGPALTATSVPAPEGIRVKLSPLPPQEPMHVTSIRVVGLPDSAREELLRTLPIHEGDTITSANYLQAVEAVHGFDEHLTIVNSRTPTENVITISAPSAGSPAPAGVIRVGSSVQSNNLIKQVRPVYPPLAKAARVQGSVLFEATIGKDGSVTNLKVLSGPPLLQQAAMEAVQQWQYKPTLLNGQPVDVQTNIEVNFALSN